MKLSEFIVMDEAGKKNAVMNNGVALATRTAPGLIIFLFQVDDYYVEAYCNITSNKVEEYCVLPGVNSIGHYLDAMPIDDLLN